MVQIYDKYVKYLRELSENLNKEFVSIGYQTSDESVDQLMTNSEDNGNDGHESNDENSVQITAVFHSRSKTRDKQIVTESKRCEEKPSFRPLVCNTNNSHTGATTASSSQPLDESQQYRCDRHECDYTTRDKQQLIEHQLTHPRNCRFKCLICECSQSFQSQLNLTQHQLTQHPDAYPDIPWIECTHKGCQYRTKFKSYIRKHKKKHIGANKAYVRQPNDKIIVAINSSKGKTSGSSNSEKRVNSHTSATTLLTQRMKKLGTNVQQYRCDRQGCDFTTEFRVRLIRHQLSHSTGGRLVCCSQSFQSERSYAQHQMNTHPDAFPDIPWIECSHTGCQFRTKSNVYINKHLKRHKVFSENVTYSCDYEGCDYKTLYRRCLTGHQKTHLVMKATVNVPCEWPNCPKVFRSAQYMRVHMNTHTTYVVYRCHYPGCGKPFWSNKSMRIHFKTHHMGNYRHQTTGTHDRITDNTSAGSSAQEVENRQEFKCLVNECNKFFKTYSDLNEDNNRLHAIPRQQTGDRNGRRGQEVEKIGLQTDIRPDIKHQTDIDLSHGLNNRFEVGKIYRKEALSSESDTILSSHSTLSMSETTSSLSLICFRVDSRVDDFLQNPYIASPVNTPFPECPFSCLSSICLLPQTNEQPSHLHR
ncbi:unnamed protein product [Oppiella nova]|uniref:C2H2-type domain-containing protein n=1 Tax=Oppiella nova TaxID=334625 RepID=A0A7R9LG12_9ACAR|nr:unnamed protein product [Oppiella nova]CAG2162835.1 unnamed protein product [Oppiella nova]